MTLVGGLPAISLVCLDMAGTTVGDDGAVEEAFEVALASEGVFPGTDEAERARGFIRQTMGQSKIAVFRALLDGDRTAAKRANAAFEEAYSGQIGVGRVLPLPGACEVLDELREAGLKVCLTTGFAPQTRDSIIEAFGWWDRIDLALSPSDAGRGRPYPDMLLTAVLRLEVDDVAQVAVVGDTASDLLSGARAGAGVLAGVLTGAHDRATLAAAPHTHILDSITDLPPLLSTFIQPSPIQPSQGEPQ